MLCRGCVSGSMHICISDLWQVFSIIRSSRSKPAWRSSVLVGVVCKALLISSVAIHCIDVSCFVTCTDPVLHFLPNVSIGVVCTILWLHLTVYSPDQVALLVLWGLTGITDMYQCLPWNNEHPVCSQIADLSVKIFHLIWHLIAARILLCSALIPIPFVPFALTHVLPLPLCLYMLLRLISRGQVCSKGSNGGSHQNLPREDSGETWRFSGRLGLDVRIRTDVW